MQATQILETCLYVDDLDAAEAFYRRVLGLELESKVPGRHVFFRCGSAVFLLFNPEVTRNARGKIPAHGATGAGHVAFTMQPEEVDAWRRQLREQAIEIEAETEWPGGGHSLYFRDPAGNSVELATLQTWEPVQVAAGPV